MGLGSQQSQSRPVSSCQAARSRDVSEVLRRQIVAQSILSYRLGTGRRRSRFRVLVIVLTMSVAMASLSIWYSYPRILNILACMQMARLENRLIERQWSSDFVVLDEHEDNVDLLLNEPSYKQLARVTRNRVAVFVDAEFDKYAYQINRQTRFSREYGSVYLGRLKAASGKVYLVGLLSAVNHDASMHVVRIDAIVYRPGSASQLATFVGISPSFEFNLQDSSRLTLYRGMPVTSRSDAVSIPFVLDGNKGNVEATITEDGQVQFKRFPK